MKKRLNIILKRVFLFLSIYLLSFYQLLSQDISFTDPYSEKMFFSPAYSGLNDCSEVNLTYNRKITSNFYSSSFNKYFNKYKSGIGIIISNNRQGNNSINNFNFDLIYSYKITINRKQIINTAIEVTYFQQNINTTNLIFNNQINPITSTISTNSNELFFKPYNGIDFSVASTFISTKYRTGIVVKHIDKTFIKDTETLLNPHIKIHFARIFKLKNNNNLGKTTFSPEIIYKFQNNYQEIIYGLHIVNNIFLTRFFIKQNLKFNTFSPVFSFGIFFRNTRLSYSYSSSFNQYILHPNSSNQLSLSYKFSCRKKRNSKKAIFCTNF